MFNQIVLPNFPVPYTLFLYSLTTKATTPSQVRAAPRFPVSIVRSVGSEIRVSTRAVWTEQVPAVGRNYPTSG